MQATLTEDEVEEHVDGLVGELDADGAQLQVHAGKPGNVRPVGGVEPQGALRGPGRPQGQRRCQNHC